MLPSMPSLEPEPPRFSVSVLEPLTEAETVWVRERSCCSGIASSDRFVVEMVPTGRKLSFTLYTTVR